MAGAFHVNDHPSPLLRGGAGIALSAGPEADSPPPDAGRGRAVVLLNRSAGAVSVMGEAALAEQLGGTFLEAGLEADIRFLPAHAISGAVDLARGQGASMVVAGGGDGTVGTVASRLVDGAIPLGILPMGTFNHFAKDLGLPMDLAAAARCLVTGRVHRVDVGEVNGQYFVNNASLGLYPLVIRERENLLEILPRPKWLATVWAALRVFRRHPLVQVTLRANGEVLSLRTPFVFVGNNRYELDLLRVNRRTCLERGELSVYTARCRHRYCIWHLLWLAARKRLEQHENFQSTCTSDLEVVSGRRSMRVALDGEVRHMREPLRFRTRPRSLRVIAPAGEGSATVPPAGE